VSADPVFFDVYSKLISDINSQGHSLAFFFLTYSLTPHASYPTQLRQCVEALRYIIIRTGHLPSNVFIGGDSAGGNLALSVLLHLSHPQPDVEPLDISQPLAGIFTIAPWGCLRLDGWPAEAENRYTDLFVKQAGDKWAQTYLNGRQPDFWSDPFLAPDEWWSGVRVKNILILAGSEEILLSQIEKFVLKLKACHYPTNNQSESFSGRLTVSFRIKCQTLFSLLVCMKAMYL
jgi:acetyl esterase/lipase